MINRRQFFRGDVRGVCSPLRPPWALGESEFRLACTRCADCVKACPQHILEPAGGGFPQVNFLHGECTFCGACVEACPGGALTRRAGVPQADQAPWPLKAHISEVCLSRKGVVCSVCGEQCETGAIRFAPGTGGVVHPRVERYDCSGCGACVRPCPVNAVAIRPPVVN